MKRSFSSHRLMLMPLGNAYTYPVDGVNYSKKAGCEPEIF